MTLWHNVFTRLFDIFWKSKNINRHVFFVSVLVYKSPVYEKKAFDLVCERLASIGYPQVI